MRVFVESVLRYGLPVNFVALLIRTTAPPPPAVVAGSKWAPPSAVASKRLLECVATAWRSAAGAQAGHLDAQYGSGGKTKKGDPVDVVIPGVTDTSTAAVPFVFTDVDLKC